MQKNLDEESEHCSAAVRVTTNTQLRWDIKTRGLPTDSEHTNTPDSLKHTSEII